MAGGLAHLPILRQIELRIIGLAISPILSVYFKNYQMETVIKNASVKVMLSYDYSHFEVSMSLENESGLSQKEIDDARKNCQRLADKAVKQYKKAKTMAEKRTNAEYERGEFERACERILKKSPDDRTIKEAAMLKQFQDENWHSQFDYNYDYEDEDEENY